MLRKLTLNLRQSTVGHLPLTQEPLYKSPDEFLEAITQRINVMEAIYKCVDAYVLPSTSIDDEYVVVVYEIMSGKLKQFYGGNYLIQQWQKNQKLFQAVHSAKPHNFFLTQQRFVYSLQGYTEECKYLYVSNFYQNVFQKINHPFFTARQDENPTLMKEGGTDRSHHSKGIFDTHESQADSASVNSKGLSFLKPQIGTTTKMDTHQPRNNFMMSEEGIHDTSLYIDPKQVIVVHGRQIRWAQLKIESILAMSTSNSKLERETKLADRKAKEQASNSEQKLLRGQFGRFQTIVEETPDTQIILTNVKFIDVLSNSSCDGDGLLPYYPSAYNEVNRQQQSEMEEEIMSEVGLVAIHAIGNEGYLKKEIHFVVEYQLKVVVFQLIVQKNITTIPEAQTFEVKPVLTFEKQFANIGVTERLRSIQLLSYGEVENIIVLVKECGESRVMSKDIIDTMIEYQKSIKQSQQEEESDDDEEEKRRLAELEARRSKLLYRLTKICRGEEDLESMMLGMGFPFKKKKNNALRKQSDQDFDSKNHVLSQVKNFFAKELKLNIFHVKRCFIRRQKLYIENQEGVVRSAKIDNFRNYNFMSWSKELKCVVDVAMLQDLTMHVNTFNDFLLANTTLILSHSKVLSIYDFLTKQWTHILPSDQSNENITRESQTYFGSPDDEIEQLMLNFIFTNQIYDCIIMYKGRYIRRLKYFNEIDRTFFEKGTLFQGQEVLQIQRNADSRNYRQYGDSTVRTLFMIEDTLMKNQQIWVSENGGRISKLIDQIPLEYQWQLIDIPNARSDYLIIYSKQERNITIYSISNSQQCLYPSQLKKYQIQKLENIDYDRESKVQYFLFEDKLYYQLDGNLMCLHLKQKKNALQMINFNKQIKEFYMTHEESVYYKDKHNIFRFAQLNIQKKFNIEKLPTEVFDCHGAFCNKIDYSIYTNRLALFTSSFEISLVPLLDRYRIDLMASQDFESNFVCWKEIDNRLIALKRPNILLTWNTDTGKIINYHRLSTHYNFNNWNRHSEWNNMFVLKKQKVITNADIERSKLKQKQREQMMYKSDDSCDNSVDLDEEEERVLELIHHNDEDFTYSPDNPVNSLFTLVEIVSPHEIVVHSQVAYECKPGMNIYMSNPYMLVMDEQCAKLFLMSSQNEHQGGLLKTPRLLQVFYEQQMKIGKPTYFSPNFLHRLFIDTNSKEVVLNYSLTNVNLFSLDIKKTLLFQLEKTHPMIYFHDDDHITYLTTHGVERVFSFKTQVATKKRSWGCELMETSNIYFNDKSFLRRFMLDPLSFNLNQASQMDSEDILKFKGDILKRHLYLNVYKSSISDKKSYDISRFLQDKNLSMFNHFIINNFRQQLTFTYLNWKIMHQLVEKKMEMNTLLPTYLSELSYTILPYNRNIYHVIGQEYEVLDAFICYVNNENIEEEMQEQISLTEILFLPDLSCQTPLHESVSSNNTRVTDRLVQALKITDFDHHSRFILSIYPDLIAQVPQSMSTYLDSRLKTPSWLKGYTRGRIAANEEDCNFVMTADKMWTEDLDDRLQGKMYQPDVLEVPLEMQILDMPHLHKYINDVADEFLEALADTECIEIFSNSSIQALIEIKWPQVKKGIKRYLFYPYLVFLIVFLYYTVYVFESYQIVLSKQESVTTDMSLSAQNQTAQSDAITLNQNSETEGFQASTAQEEGFDKDLEKIFKQLLSAEYYLSKEIFIVKTVVILFTLYFFTLELRQMFLQGIRKYMGNPWNYLDIIPLVLITTGMSFANLGIGAQYERPCNAVACFFMWMKFLYFWRIFRQTSKFISMIVAIIGDLRVFMIVFIVTLTAFGNSLYIMSNNNPICDEECQALPEEERPAGRFINSMTESVFFAYCMSLGDFDVSNLGSVYFILAVSTFIVATLFLTIMMLNLLVAVISDSYARVESTSIEEMYKNFADLISENEFLVPHRRLVKHDKMGDYLYIAKVDKNDDLTADAWEGKLNNLKQQLIKRTEGIEQLLIVSQKSLVDSINQTTESFIQLTKTGHQKEEDRMNYFIRKMDQYLPAPQKPSIADRRQSILVSDLSGQGPFGNPNISPQSLAVMKRTTQNQSKFMVKRGGQGTGLQALGSLFGNKQSKEE